MDNVLHKSTRLKALEEPDSGVTGNPSQKAPSSRKLCSPNSDGNHDASYMSIYDDDVINDDMVSILQEIGREESVLSSHAKETNDTFGFNN